MNAKKIDYKALHDEIHNMKAQVLPAKVQRKVESNKHLDHSISQHQSLIEHRRSTSDNLSRVSVMSPEQLQPIKIE